MKKSTKILDLPPLDRPREKLFARGALALSDFELMMVMLGKGSRSRSVWDLAREVLKTFDAPQPDQDLRHLLAIPGIGKAKAATLAAALEFARRRLQPQGFKLVSPIDALVLVRHYADRKQEHFLVITLNGANEVIAHRLITVGLVNRSQVHPREVFAEAITDRASAIIVAHNHPSGSLQPSIADMEVTHRLKSAGALLGIPLLDHIIFTAKGHYSFSEAGRL